MQATTIFPPRRRTCVGKTDSVADVLAPICAVLLSLQLWDHATKIPVESTVVKEPSRRTLAAVQEGNTTRPRSFDGRRSSARQEACLPTSTFREDGSTGCSTLYENC